MPTIKIYWITVKMDDILHFVIIKVVVGCISCEVSCRLGRSFAVGGSTLSCFFGILEPFIYRPTFNQHATCIVKPNIDLLHYLTS